MTFKRIPKCLTNKNFYSLKREKEGEIWFYLLNYVTTTIFIFKSWRKINLQYNYFQNYTEVFFKKKKNCSFLEKGTSNRKNAHDKKLLI